MRAKVKISLKNRVKGIYELFSLDLHSLRYKHYLKKKSLLQSTSSTSLFLIEFEQSPENVVALSMFLPVYRELSDANFAGYQISDSKRVNLLANIVRFRYSTTSTLIGKKFFQIKVEELKREYFLEIFRQYIHSKRELEIFTHMDIQIGDLVYDEYLAKHGAPTVDLSDSRLKNIFVKALGALEWWIEFEKEW